MPDFSFQSAHWDECKLVQELADFLECPICCEAFIQPLDHIEGGCGYTMCSGCWAGVSSCPSCRRECKRGSSLSFNRTLNRGVDSLQVDCNICHAKMPRSDFGRHYHTHNPEPPKLKENKEQPRELQAAMPAWLPRQQQQRQQQYPRKHPIPGRPGEFRKGTSDHEYTSMLGHVQNCRHPGCHRLWRGRWGFFIGGRQGSTHFDLTDCRQGDSLNTSIGWNKSNPEA